MDQGMATASANEPWIGEAFAQGGPVMFILLGVFLLGVGFCVYCLILLRRRMLFPATLVNLAESFSGTDYAQAEDACRNEGGPLGEILLTVLVSRELNRDEAESLVESAGRRAAHDLSRGVLVLEVIAAISPLLGLLGTVMGMYEVFGRIAEVGAQEVHKLSGGIHEALVTTIAGLAVGIPAYVAYVFFSRRVQDLVLVMERHAIALMLRLRHARGGSEADA